MTDIAHVPDVPPSAGALLRAAREARGLSVDEVAGRLRLRPHLVEALERDDLAALGAGPYGRGQLRNYARLVGVDEQRVLPARPLPASVPAPTPGGLRRPSLVQRPRSRWPMRLLTLAVLGIVGILSVLWNYGSGPAPDEQPAGQPSPPTAPNPPVPPAPRPPTPGLSAPPTGPGTTPGGGPASPPAVAPGGVVPPPTTPGAGQTPIDIPGLPAVTTAAPESSPVSPAPATANADLVLTFTGACWVEVTDQTGARLLYRMARAGDRHVLRGSPPFAVTLGNAGAVHLTYNGEPFAKPEIDRPVARLRVGD